VRARLHRRVAEVLERRHAGDPSVPLDQIAHHWLAGGEEVAARAVDATEAAAQAADLRRVRRAAMTNVVTRDEPRRRRAARPAGTSKDPGELQIDNRQWATTSPVACFLIGRLRAQR
jgi:hypothetical protein